MTAGAEILFRVKWACDSLSEGERQDFFQAYKNEAVIERYKRDAASWHWRLACYYFYRQERLKGVKPELSDGYGEALAKEVAYLQALSLVS